MRRVEELGPRTTRNEWKRECKSQQATVQKGVNGDSEIPFAFSHTPRPEKIIKLK